jgi:hypothetical protein
VAVIPLALTVAVAGRFGRGAVLRYALGGALVAGVFAAVSWAFVERPFERIVEDNLYSAYAWTEEGGETPDLLSRARFEVTHLLFLTPIGLFAPIYYLLSAAGRRGQPAGDWSVRFAIPLGIVVYALAMLNVGGFFPRFFAPLVPLALFVAADLAYLCCTSFRLGQEGRGLLLLTVGSITIAWGVWPASVLHEVKANLQHRPLFSGSFREQLLEAAGGSEALYCPPIPGLADLKGLPAMVELRRTLNFPTASTTANGNIAPDRNVGRAVSSLVKNLPDGALIVVPSSLSPEDVPGVRVAGDGDWSVYRLEKGAGRTIGRGKAMQ